MHGCFGAENLTAQIEMQGEAAPLNRTSLISHLSNKQWTCKEVYQFIRFSPGVPLHPIAINVMGRKARYKRGLIGGIAIRIEHILIYGRGAHNILET